MPQLMALKEKQISKLEDDLIGWNVTKIVRPKLVVEEDLKFNKILFVDTIDNNTCYLFFLYKILKLIKLISATCFFKSSVQYKKIVNTLIINKKNKIFYIYLFCKPIIFLSARLGRRSFEFIESNQPAEQPSRCRKNVLSDLGEY